MRLPLLLVVFSWMGSTLLAAELPMLDYQWRGGHSAYNEVRVIVAPSGEAEATWDKQRAEKASYQIVLSKDEVAHLQALIRASDVFEADPPPHPGVTDTGESVLRVSLDGRERTSKYSDRPSLEPMTQMLWKLITQGELLQGLARQQDIDKVLGGLSESHAARKVLQPQVFLSPLQEFVGISDDRQKTQCALEAIACIATPEVFAGFINRTAQKDASRRQMMLSIVGTYPFSGNISKPHLAALNAYCLAFVKENMGRRAQLPRDEQNAIAQFVGSLRYGRYAPAIPWLVQQIVAGDQGYEGSLSAMGEEGVRQTLQLLDDRGEHVRLSGVEVMVCASRNGPKGGFANPVSEWEYQRMSRVFEEWGLPQLRRMAAGDTSPKVQEKAKAAIEEISGHLQREEHTPKEE